MALINFQQKEIVVKIVYFGPASSGKTTNLHKLHEHIPSKLVGDLATLDTEDERTLFFDYFPIEAGAIGRYKLKLQIYSVPGQAYYRATRKMVLQNADGVVFIADSQASEIEHNIVAFSDLEENLRSYGVDLETFPIVIQYNKRDLENVLPTDFLDRKLNLRGYPYCEGVAIEGKGVLEAFNGIVELVTRRLRSELSRSEQGQPLDGDFFQPLGDEQDDEEVVSNLVHRIADLGEHGERDLQEALAAVGEVPLEPEEPGPSRPVSQGPVGVALKQVGQTESGAFALTFGSSEGHDIHVSLPRDRLEHLVRAVVPPPEPKEPARPQKSHAWFMMILFFWLVALTAWIVLFLP